MLTCVKKVGSYDMNKKITYCSNEKKHARKAASKIKRYHKENREKMTRKGYTIL